MGDDARHDIAGVVIAVVGVAALIAVLTPTSGVLTQAVSNGLHALLGLGAFLLPVCLLLWAASFFVRVPSLIPGRVAIGLALIALAAMGIVGLCTPGCEADPGRLFNAYVLADRGGYIGNGLAWLLLTLTGKTVGIVVLAGVVVAGLVVIGLNVTQAAQSILARARSQAAYSRLRSEERRARSQAAAWDAQYGAGAPHAAPSGMPYDYAPTALFDPARPLSQQGGSQAGPTAYMGGMGGAAAPAVRTPSRPVSRHFGCGNTPGMASPVPPQPESVPPTAYLTCDEAGEPAFEQREALRPSVPATTFLQPDVQPGAEAYVYSTGETVAPVTYTEEDLPSEEGERRPSSRRARSASSWWDPADDWKRDDFDPSDTARRTDGAPLPGVLPGAPTSVDELEVHAQRYVERESVPEAAPAEVVHAVPAEPPAPAAVRTSASQAPVAEEPKRPPRPSVANRATGDGTVSGKVELPWEDAAVPAAAPEAPAQARRSDPGTFVLPDPSIMHRGENALERSPEQRREAAEMAGVLQTTLTEFGVKAEVVDWVEGPTCTTYEVNPGEGVRVNRFTTLEDDIARALARNGVRIYAPVPGTSYVGIEVPNNTRQTVYFGDVLPYVDGGPLDFAVGLDANGKPVHCDLAKLPHILVAGTTGSGKSVMVNTIVMSMLMRDTPDEVRLIMIDPKQVEFNDYNGIPHLIMPVVTDMRQAAAALQWGVTEMDRRYRVFSNVGVRDLKSYNRLVEEGTFDNDEFPLATLPSIVIVIDELADLMMVAKKDVEASIVRIAQLGRACGIHLVMATQSPRADVVTGLIRANVANRIGLKVAKSTDSKIVIDQGGAEKLLGNGDMLFLQTAWGDRPRRIQGCWISDNEIAAVVAHLKEQSSPEYNYQMAPLPGSQAAGGSYADDGASEGGAPSSGSDDDPLAWEAARLVVENQMGSTSMIQRRLKLGYARAGRVMDMLEEMGVVGPARGSKPRDVLIRDLDELATLRGLEGSEGDL